MRNRKKRNRFLPKILIVVAGVLMFSGAFEMGKKIAYKNVEAVQATVIKSNSESIKDGSEDAVNNTDDKIGNTNITTSEEKPVVQQAEQKPVQQPTPQVAPQPVAQNTSATAKPDGSKVAYLTFDDGPTYNVTPQVLNILKTYNVKATFFVVGNMARNNPGLLTREKNEGNVIANHSYSHVYSSLYASTTSFMNEIVKCNQTVDSIIGSHDGKLVRLPGGSFGRQAYKDVLVKSGYHYVDWNCLTGDEDGKTYTKDQLFNNFKASAENKKELIILMHDIPSKSPNVQVLPEIIQYLKANGYEFKTLQ